MNNTRAYLALFGNYDYRSNTDFMNLFNQVQHKTPVAGLPAAYVFYSDADLDRFYQVLDGTEATLPIIIPLDVNSIQTHAKLLPSWLRTFGQFTQTKAA